MKDIIVVEDGKSERERLLKLCSEAGYSVDVCDSVGEAEQILLRETYRLAILDIGLNDKSGSLLFTALRRGSRVTYVVIFTGNPSVHLKQRFLNEGAVDYIVKGSSSAQSEALLSRIREILGSASTASAPSGIPLDEFLSRCVAPSSRALFFGSDGSVPPCPGCAAQHFIVSFSGQPQVPPAVVGHVMCGACGRPLDPEVS